MRHENYVQKKIQQVAIFDDQPNARESLAEIVEDAHLTPIVQDEPIVSLEACIETVQTSGSAAIFDNHLSQRNYANFRGILAVKSLYLLCIPALLVTTYFYSDISEIREYLPYTPAIITPDELNSDMIIKGFEICQNEFAGKFSPERKPWRSLVRVEEIKDEKSVYVVIPSWNASEKILLPISIFPIQDEKIEGMRFFAQVNIGAESYSDLYCYNIESEINLKQQVISQKSGADMAKQTFSERWKGQFKLSNNSDDSRLDYLKQRYQL
jgi:hypothetical protein